MEELFTSLPFLVEIYSPLFTLFLSLDFIELSNKYHELGVYRALLVDVCYAIEGLRQNGVKLDFESADYSLLWCTIPWKFYFIFKLFPTIIRIVLSIIALSQGRANVEAIFSSFPSCPDSFRSVSMIPYLREYLSGFASLQPHFRPLNQHSSPPSPFESVCQATANTLVWVLESKCSNISLLQ